MGNIFNLSESRFNILKIVTKGFESVSEIAKKLNYSVPYVHQQVTLLEAKGYLNKKILKVKDVGKPRNIYQIANQNSNVTLLRKNFAKTFELSDDLTLKYLQILGNLPPEVHSIVSRYYWNNIDDVSKIKAISFLGFDEDKVELFVLTDNKNVEKLRKDISNVKMTDGRTIVCWVNTFEECEKGAETKDTYYLSHIAKAKAVLDDDNLFDNLKEKI